MKNPTTKILPNSLRIKQRGGTEQHQIRYSFILINLLSTVKLLYKPLQNWESFYHEYFTLIFNLFFNMV